MLNFSLVSIIVWIEKRRHISKYSRLEWFTSDLLQLQRLAHEEIEFGTWTECVGAKVVPVTAKGEVLVVLDLQDPTHPRLLERPQVNERVEISTRQTEIQATEPSDSRVPEKTMVTHIDSADLASSSEQTESSAGNHSAQAADCSDAQLPQDTQESSSNFLQANLQDEGVYGQLETQKYTTAASETEMTAAATEERDSDAKVGPDLGTKQRSQLGS